MTIRSSRGVHPGEGVEHLAAVQREEPPKLLAMQVEEASVRVVSATSEQHDVHVPVALLECQPPFKRLNVA